LKFYSGRQEKSRSSLDGLTGIFVFKSGVSRMLKADA